MNKDKDLERTKEIERQRILDAAKVAADLVIRTANDSAITLTVDIKYIKEQVAEIKNKLEGSYITRQEFAPIKSFVYGLISLIVVAVGVAIISLVINK